MNRIVFIVLLVAGVIMLVFGIRASDSISSDFSRLFTGNPTDKAVWLMIGGAVASIVGIAGLAHGAR